MLPSHPLLPASCVQSYTALRHASFWAAVPQPLCPSAVSGAPTDFAPCAEYWARPAPPAGLGHLPPCHAGHSLGSGYFSGVVVAPPREGAGVFCSSAASARWLAGGRLEGWESVVAVAPSVSVTVSWRAAPHLRHAFFVGQFSRVWHAKHVHQGPGGGSSGAPLVLRPSGPLSTALRRSTWTDRSPPSTFSTALQSTSVARSLASGCLGQPAGSQGLVLVDR